MNLKGLNSISADSYFIRLKDNKETFLHFEGDNPDNPKEEVVYRLKQGTVGAGIWHKKEAEALIQMSGANNLEMVKASEIIKDDGTRN